MAPVATAALAVLAAAVTAAAAAPAPKPHVLLILADDYGWANFGVHRRDAATSQQARAEVHTPNLDSLVDTGVLLDRHYAYKICSPSRSSLQSGRLAVHVNVHNTGVTNVNESDPVSGAPGIPRNMTGVAQKLRGAGYRTHMVGKWDAGMATPEHTPLGRGYESWLGYYQHANDYWRKSVGITSTGEVDNCLNSLADFSMHNATYRGGVRDGPSTSAECYADPNSHPECYEEYLFKQRALSVVQEHNVSDVESPLFLFYSFHLLHTPLQVPDTYLQKVDALLAAAGGASFDSQNRRLYAAMTLYMDDVVGELVGALKAKGMWDNTLVVFTSDNGGPLYSPGAANNYPLKGGKYSDWEGGVRVNAFVSGGFVPLEKRGTVFSGVVSIADWYGTLCELAGVDSTDHAAAEANVWLQQKGLPLLPPVDSVAQWGFILNGTNGRPALHLSTLALLRWPFKLVVGKQSYSRWQGELYPNCSTVRGVDADEGPLAGDIKVFGASVELGETPELQEKLTWTSDCGQGCLFNVEADPTEHADLSSNTAFSETLAQLQAELRGLNNGFFDPGRGTESLAACEQGIGSGGYYGPFVKVDGWYSPVPPRTTGERQKDEALKLVLRLLNKDIVKYGVSALGKAYLPSIRQRWMSSLDKCFANATGGAAATILV